MSATCTEYCSLTLVSSLPPSLVFVCAGVFGFLALGTSPTGLAHLTGMESAGRKRARDVGDRDDTAGVPAIKNGVGGERRRRRNRFATAEEAPPPPAQAPASTLATAPGDEVSKL